MGEGRIAYDGDSREEACICSTFCHCDAGTHIHTRREGLEWRQSAKRITSDIAKDTMVRIVGKYLIQSCIDISVTTTLTKLWRTGCHILCWSEDGSICFSESLCNIIRSEFACPGKVACQTSFHSITCAKNTLDEFLHNGLSVLYDEEFVTLLGQSLDLVFRQRILRNLDQIGVTSKRFFHVVIGYATRQNARLHR